MSYRDKLEAYARIIATERPYRPALEERQLEQAMADYLGSPARDNAARNDFAEACNAYDERITTPRRPKRKGLLDRVRAFCFVDGDEPQGEVWP